MVTLNAQHRLIERFDRSVQSPRLMMLYPPVSTGRPYTGELSAVSLWEGASPQGTLYLHIPFCRSRCLFCPFFAVVGNQDDFGRYVDRVLAEAVLYAPAVSRMEFTSVYLGGGTPSVFPPRELERLLRGLRGMLRMGKADITMEANPATVNRQRLHDLHAAGITRLSLGIQSFDPHVLRASDRADTVDHVLGSLEAALDTPFRDVNIDLMYGLPEQTRDSWMRDLGIAARLKVPGLTLYPTAYLPAFEAHCKTQGFAVPSAGERLEMYDMAYDYLVSNGYPQPHFGAGAFLRGGLNPHRRNVSHGLPTLGLGTWAFSSTGPYAYHNLTPTEDWAADVGKGALPIRQLLTIPEEERARKFVIEALLLAYVDLAHFRATFGTELAEAFPDALAVLHRLDLAKVEDGELRLTRKGGHHLREIRYLFASDRVVHALEDEGTEGL